MGELVGYARVSSRGQSLEAQIERLVAAGVPDTAENLYTEKISGRTAARPALDEMLKYVRKGDKVVITKLDRLARSLTDLMQILSRLKQKSVDLVVLDQHIDTATPTGRLMLQMLGAIAEFEAELIQERAEEGRQRALANGVRFGAESKFTAAQLAELREAFERDGSNKSQLARQYGISRSSLYRLATGPVPKNLAGE